MNHYSESTQTVSKSAINMPDLQEQLNQAIRENESLKNRLLAAHFSAEQANAARDDYTQKYQSCLVDIDRLEKQIAGRDQRIAKLEQDYLNYRNTLRQEQSIIYHPKIQQARDRILLSKLLAVEALKKPDENGFIEFSSDEITKGAHLSKGAFFDGLTSLEKYGVVERDPDNYLTTDKRVCRIKINPTVHTDVSNCVKEVKSNYGGERATQCPECHRERIKKTRKKATVCQCMDCKHQWIEDESEKVIKEPPVTAQDYAERDIQPATEEVPEEVLTKHMDTLFPDMQEKQKVEVYGNHSQPLLSFAQDAANKPPRPHPLCHPSAGWEYDDLIEKWFCEVCHHG